MIMPCCLHQNFKFLDMFKSLQIRQEIIGTCIKIMLIQKNESHLELLNRKSRYTQTNDYIKIDLHRTSQNADIYIIICSQYYILKALIKSPVIIIITSSHNANYSSISSSRNHFKLQRGVLFLRKCKQKVKIR